MRYFAIALCAAALSGMAFAQTQKTFGSPDAAAGALIDAAQHQDLAAIGTIFAPEGRNILMTGDADRDRSEIKEFARLATNKHRLEGDPMNRNRMILSVGIEDWPFPVPIVRTNGQWRFDAVQGAAETRTRRIGSNELDAIEICAGYVEAQRKYAAAARDGDGVLKYARFIMSSPGKRDGLFGAGSDALVPERFAEASVAASPRPYHGYYFRILTSQGPDARGGAHNYLVRSSLIGGFGLVAWPAEYGVTGVQTLIVNQDGVVYEKDLGKPASNLLPPVTSFNPGKGWTRVE